VFFVLAGASALINQVLRVDWASLFNPAWAMEQLWTYILDGDPLEGPGALQCAVGLAIMAALLLRVLWHRLRPVEVVA
jgi:hypothetical protein